MEVLDGLVDKLPASPLSDGPTDDDLAEGMSAWAALDRDTRDAAGRTCRRHVRDNFTWERTADELLGEYARILA